MGEGKVPFSWEDMPGVSKAETKHNPPSFAADKLPPPPYQRWQKTRNISSHQMQNVPLPLCAFQLSPPVLSQRNSTKNEDDPFLVAYRECTKSPTEVDKSSKHGSGSGLTKRLSAFSWNRSCSVKDGSLISVSHSEP